MAQVEEEEEDDEEEKYGAGEGACDGDGASEGLYGLRTTTRGFTKDSSVCADTDDAL